MRLRSLVFGLKIESFIHLLIYVTIPMGSSDTMFGKIKKQSQNQNGVVQDQKVGSCVVHLPGFTRYS